MKNFKTCSMCGEIWNTRDDFLTDVNLSVNGYMANFDHIDLGIFQFYHKLCKTTLALSTSEFIDLYGGPVYKERLTGTEECPEYCLNKNELRSCLAKCECAYVREVLNILNKLKKN